MTTETLPETAASANQSPIIDGLQKLVAQSYALMGQTHYAHWNVEGPTFFALHEAFEQQYNELFTAIDEIAERIRALGAYSVGGLKKMADLAGVDEADAPLRATEFVEGLLLAHEKTLETAKHVRDLSADNGDKETEDMMIARIQVHEKTVWMLRSFLRG
ncbi:MAG: Dps family protein [Opitutales bacterium]